MLNTQGSLNFSWLRNSEKSFQPPGKTTKSLNKVDPCRGESPGNIVDMKGADSQAASTVPVHSMFPGSPFVRRLPEYP